MLHSGPHYNGNGLTDDDDDDDDVHLTLFSTYTGTITLSLMFET